MEPFFFFFLRKLLHGTCNKQLKTDLIHHRSEIYWFEIAKLKSTIVWSNHSRFNKLNPKYKNYNYNNSNSIYLCQKEKIEY